jgi:hypothetical protein
MMKGERQRSPFYQAARKKLNQNAIDLFDKIRTLGKDRDRAKSAQLRDRSSIG